MPAAYDRCIQHVKGKKGVSNPYAVCRASMGSDKQILARSARRAQLTRQKRGQ